MVHGSDFPRTRENFFELVASFLVKVRVVNFLIGKKDIDSVPCSEVFPCLFQQAFHTCFIETFFFLGLFRELLDAFGNDHFDLLEKGTIAPAVLVGFVPTISDSFSDVIIFFHQSTFSLIPLTVSIL